MIRFFNEDSDYILKRKQVCREWIKLVCESEIKKVGDINVIFCSDNYVLDVNVRFLQHDYFTDIITFDYCEGDRISGDLFISVDSVRENASFYGVSFEEEMHRVIVHGVLHLIGFDDHSEDEVATMRNKENYYLDILSKL